MPTNTYTPLANITLGSAAASVTFSSISQAYRDLILVINGTSSGTTGYQLRVNGDTGSNYTQVTMAGTGSAAQSTSYSTTQVYLMDTGANAGDRLSFITQLMDYSATDKHKSMLIRADYPSGLVEANACRWANTAAITSIVAFTNASTWAAGSTFSLFGVAA